MDLDKSRWSGEGQFTETLIEALKALQSISYLLVEDAPATRSDADYNFISNEMFVRFQTKQSIERRKWTGIIPVRRTFLLPVMTLADLGKFFVETETVGEPDYIDEGMIQFLKSERIIPPYQTRGYKLVELVRIYEVKDS